MNAPIVAMNDDDIIDSRKVFAALAAKRWWVAASVVLFTLGFTTAAFVITPIYSATTILVPARTGQSSGGLGALGDLGGLVSLAGISIGSRGSETEEALAVLRSREFTERFMADENLLPKLFASRWNAAAGTWKSVPPTPAKAYRYFNTKIRSIEQDKKTGLVSLEIDWKDRTEAAAWANELVQRLNQEMRVRALAAADASLGYLDNELQTTTVVATREAIGHLIESQVKSRMVANVSKEFAFRVVDRAMPADADSPVRPQKLLMVAAGFFTGLMIGIVYALVSSGARRRTATN